MSDRTQPLSGFNHHVTQSIPSRRWTAVVVDGKTLFKPTDTERGFVGAQLLGFVGRRRPRNIDIRLVRRGIKPADPTGYDSVVVPVGRRRWNKSYPWSGLIEVDRPFTLELYHDGADPITVWNAAFKEDWFASEGEPVW